MDDKGDIETSDVGGVLERNGSSFYEDKELVGAREPLLRKATTNNTSQIAIVGANLCPIESLDYE